MAKTLVCRCEDVTLQELEHAVERGYTDIESLKRYTGFGTGWCQGKWCVALCARLLVQRGGIASDPITPRPPLHPLRLADLAGLADVAEEDARAGRPPR
jgi:NAD(P)H-nitrite reductase large subunit